MADLFQRRARLTVDGIQVEDLRLQFTVKKSAKKEPNTAEISVFNLAQATRGRLQARGARVVLEAGYPDTLGTIFSGDARTIDHVRTGAEWVTKIQCGDGERAYQFRNAALSFSAGARRADVVAAVIDSLGLLPGNAAAQVAANVTGSTSRFLNGYSGVGNSARQLDNLLRPVDLTWSIQDGEIQVLTATGTRREIAVVLDKDTGLIGSPEHGAPDKKGKPSVLKCRSLLQAVIKPGSRVLIKSLNTNGHYRVETVTHSGDTAGGDWYSSLEARPV